MLLFADVVAFIITFMLLLLFADVDDVFAVADVVAFIITVMLLLLFADVDDVFV